MAKWFYGRSVRRLMDERLASDFIRQMTRRYGLGALIQIAAVPISLFAPRVGVAVAVLCVAFFLLPQPKPRYDVGEEPEATEEANA